MIAVRSERRVVRPFSGLGDVASSLEQSALFLNGAALEFNSITREPDELMNDSFSLRLAVDTEEVARAVERMGIPEVDVGLAVMATGRSLKKTKILHFSSVVSNSAPNSIALDPAEYPYIFGDKRGFDVRCCVVLMHELQPRPLRPHLAGTWLATRDFSVRVRSDALSGFSPQRLTNEVRESYDLPSKAMTYLAIHDESLLDATDLNEMIDFYIDAQVLDLMHANQATPIGQALQAHYAIEFLVGVLSVIVRDIDERQLTGMEDTALDSNSAAGALVHGVAERAKITVSMVCDEVRVDTSRLRARLQASMDLGKLQRAALNRGGE